MMKRKNYQRKTFVNQSSRIVQRYPEHKDEILEFVSQVNIKYEKLAQTVSPKRDISSDCFSVNESKSRRNCILSLYILRIFELHLHVLSIFTFQITSTN